VPTTGTAVEPEGAVPALAFSPSACGAAPSSGGGPAESEAASLPRQKRAYRRRQPQLPRWWRTRVDPFAEVWTEIEQALEARPERTAKSLFEELQQRYPGSFSDAQLRTLQRRIARWRATVMMTFDDAWLGEEVLLDVALPRPLRAASLAENLSADGRLLGEEAEGRLRREPPSPRAARRPAVPAPRRCGRRGEMGANKGGKRIGVSDGCA
jgi:hypothetical protein